MIMYSFPMEREIAQSGISKAIGSLAVRSDYDPERTIGIIGECGGISRSAIAEDLRGFDESMLERIAANAAILRRYASAANGNDAAAAAEAIIEEAGSILAIRSEVRKEAEKIRKESEDRMMRMERSYTAVFAVFTVLVFALAGGLFLALGGLWASYSEGSIEDLRTAILLIGAFFLTVISIIIKLLSTLVPPAKEKEKRNILGRFIAAIRQPITIAMLFLVLGLISSADSSGSGNGYDRINGSAVSNTLSNVLPIAEDVLIDL